ncbi:MAG: hypothetical protein K6A40_06175 [Solobacterium sp.]|nr:hypothetical protein [Solobacterium sp.]
MKKQTSLQEQIRKYYIVLAASMLLVVSAVISIAGIQLYWSDISAICEETLMTNKELIENRLTEIRNNQEILAKSVNTREYARYYQETAGDDPVLNLEYQHQIRGYFYLLSRNISTNSSGFTGGKDLLFRP